MIFFEILETKMKKPETREVIRVAQIMMYEVIFDRDCAESIQLSILRRSRAIPEENEAV